MPTLMRLGQRESLLQVQKGIRAHHMSDYGPNTYIPERYEAERDEHETAQANGQCTFADPCAACKRMMNR